MSINNISVKDILNSVLKDEIRTKKLSKQVNIENTTIGDLMYSKSIFIKTSIVYSILLLICAAILFILYNI